MSGSVSLNAALSLRSGAVLSATGGTATMGGKFIVTADFAEKTLISFSDDGFGDVIVTGGDDMDLSMTIEVYDNSNFLQDTFTYTIEDLMGIDGGMYLSVMPSVKKIAPKSFLHK